MFWWRSSTYSRKFSGSSIKTALFCQTQDGLLKSSCCCGSLQATDVKFSETHVASLPTCVLHQAEQRKRNANSRFSSVIDEYSRGFPSTDIKIRPVWGLLRGPNPWRCRFARQKQTDRAMPSPFAAPKWGRVPARTQQIWKKRITSPPSLCYKWARHQVCTPMCAYVGLPAYLCIWAGLDVSIIPAWVGGNYTVRPQFLTLGSAPHPLVFIILWVWQENGVCVHVHQHNHWDHLNSLAPMLVW